MADQRRDTAGRTAAAIAEATRQPAIAALLRGEESRMWVHVSGERPNSIAALFAPKPQTWGLRGDPYLWDELAAALGELAPPTSAAQLEALIAAAYLRLTGAPLERDEPLFVARYAHGGMSSGMVYPPFWRETAFPLLLRRYLAAMAG